MNQDIHNAGYQDYLRQCWTQQLAREAISAIQYYRIAIACPTLTLSVDKQRYGVFDPERYSISISETLVRDYSWDMVVGVLKHELAHALVFVEYGHDDSMHGEFFAKACQRLGVAPWARSASIEIDPASAMAKHRQLADEEERLLRKVEKLLSLAASSNEHEASLAMQRARELCARHHLESLSRKKHQDYTYIVISHQKKQIPTWQWHILGILNEHFYVSSVSRSLYHAVDRVEYRVVDLMGTRENVQMAEYVYWFLFNQLPLLFDQFRKDKSQQPRNARNSFYLGVLRGFQEKLQKQKADLLQKSQEWGLQEDQRAQTGLEKSSARELQSFVRSRFPSTSGGGRHDVSLAAEAYNSGQDRGRELNLHRGLHQQHSGPVKQFNSKSC